MNKNFAHKMDFFIDEYYKNNKNSGCLRVTLKDKIIYEKFIGYADIENKVEFTNNSMFTLYSLSKPFCAIGLMILKDKGMVDINLHPGTYLDEAKGFAKDLTIKHLMQHVSGVPDFIQNTDFREKYEGETSEQLRNGLLLLSKKDMLFAPGTKAHYTNTNYIICALIIENVTGMQYADYMKNEIFTPNPLNSMGLGCTVNKWYGKKRIVHNGGLSGFRTMHVQLPEDDFDIILLSNSGWGNARRDIIEAIYSAYYGNSTLKSDILKMDVGYIS